MALASGAWCFGFHWFVKGSRQPTFVATDSSRIGFTQTQRGCVRMHSAVKLWVGYRDLRVLFLAFRGFALRGFERDFVRLIADNRAAISETVEQPLF